MKGLGGRQRPSERRLAGFVSGPLGILVPKKQHEDIERAQKIISDIGRRVEAERIVRPAKTRKGTKQHVHASFTRRDPLRTAHENRRRNRAARKARRRNRV